MKILIRTFALSGALCLALTTSASLFAQDNQDNTQQSGHEASQGGGFDHGPPSPEQELAHMTKALDLSNDQQSQLKPILQHRREELQQLRQDTNTPRQDKFAKMKALDQESNSKVEAILNPEQKTKYEGMVAKRHERREEMQHQHGGGESQPQ